jgi:hypothetical protein
MLNDFDQALGVWLQRIGIKPFKQRANNSPLINEALMHFSWPNAKAIIEAHLDDPDDPHETTALFEHCGVPNIILAQINYVRLIESLELYGTKLPAHPTQANFLYQTAFFDWIVYDYESESPVPCPISIASEDKREYKLISQKHVSRRDERYSLRRDNGFMLCHSLVEYLLWPNENTISDFAVSLLPYVNWPLTRLLNQISKAKTQHIPVDFEFIQASALAGDKVSLSEMLSTAIQLPYDLTPSRFRLVENNYESRYLTNQTVFGA